MIFVVALAAFAFRRSNFVSFCTSLALELGADDEDEKREGLPAV